MDHADLHLKVEDIYIGADRVNRTPDLLITNQLLYQLSYAGLPYLLSSTFSANSTIATNTRQSLLPCYNLCQYSKNRL